MILLFSGVLLIILLARVNEEITKTPFILSLIVISYIVNLLFPGLYGSLGESFDEILLMMLPLILLPDLLGLTIEEIRRHIGAFLYLALFAVCASIAIAAGITHLVLPEYQLSIGMLIALFAMLMATDAVTVSSLFNRFPLPSQLKIYVEGESLFNDVTALIIFYFVALPLLGGETMNMAALNIVIVKTLAVSIALGAGACLMGFLALKLMKDVVEQFIIIYLVSILSFVAAEHMHASGILATVVGVLGLKYFVDREHAARPPGHDTVITDATSYYDTVMELLRRVPALTTRGFIAFKKEAHYIGLFANAIVFVSMANLIEISRILDYSKEIILVFLLTTVVRGLFVYPFVATQKLPLRWGHIMTLAGMKGGLAIIMVHSLPDTFIYMEMFEAIVVGNVLLSIFIYSLIVLGYLRVAQHAFEEDRRRYKEGVSMEDVTKHLRDIVEKHHHTRLYNPAIFEDIVTSEVARAGRYGMDMALLVISWETEDGKNKRHAEMVRISKLVREQMRNSDIAGHLDNDRIGVLTTGTAKSGAKVLADRIEQGLRSDGISGRLSIGISEFDEGDTPDMLIEKAAAELNPA